MKRLWVLGIAAIVAMAGSTARALPVNLIQNGDFEANGGSLEGWTTSGDVTLAQAGGYDPWNLGISFGMDDHFALLGRNVSSGSSSLLQSFSAAGLTKIHIAFDWGWAQYDGSDALSDEFIAVYAQGVNGGPSIRITLMDLLSHGTYLDRQNGILSGRFSNIYDLGDSGGGSAISFEMRETVSSYTNGKAGIDNVSVNAVPEPGTMMLLGSGLLGIAGLGRTRMRRKQ